MKKLLLTTLSATAALALLTGCGSTSSNEETLTTIKVGATPAPHAEILEKADEILNQLGYDIEIVEYTDYVQPNLALDQGALDANYFQHQPYLDSFNEENGLTLQTVSAVHYEPFGIYAGKTSSLDELEKGAKVAVPNDATNEARALLLLEENGLIELDKDAGLSATIKDIKSNPLNLDIIEIEAAQIPRSLADVDIAVINGNYAIEAGLNALKDALAIESSDSLAATTFANILVVKEVSDNPAIQALIEVLEGEEIKEFIQTKYEGAVVAIN